MINRSALGHLNRQRIRVRQRHREARQLHARKLPRSALLRPVERRRDRKRLPSGQPNRELRQHNDRQRLPLAPLSRGLHLHKGPKLRPSVQLSPQPRQHSARQRLLKLLRSEHPHRQPLPLPLPLRGPQRLASRDRSKRPRKSLHPVAASLAPADARAVSLPYPAKVGLAVRAAVAAAQASVAKA